MSLRGFVEQARQAGYLVEIHREVSPHLELARVAAALDGRPVLFHRVTAPHPTPPPWNTTGEGATRVLVGAGSAREYYARTLGVSAEKLLSALANALEHPRPSEMVNSGACQQVVESDVDLGRLPILTHLSTDRAPYITAGVAIIRDPDYGRNVSFHRLMVTGPRTVVARIVEGRGTDTAWRKAQDGLPVAICVGNSLPVLLAASMSPPKGVDELGIANAMQPTPLVQCKTVNLQVPAESEFVLEGHITHQLADEGPFLDLTETMDFVRQQPVVVIDCLTHRRDAIYQALLPGKLEHKLLMGMPKEPTIFAAVSQVCECRDVVITSGGTSWLHAVVSIVKHNPEDSRRAIEAAFAGHGSLKHVVVVDDDINVHDPVQVEWAIATRFQADRDLIVLADQPGSSLDPSATHVPGQKARTAKMGLDATITWGANRKEYEKMRYEKVDAREYLNTGQSLDQ
jgi:2,5-furandicarboxylate decarboxylase 1